MTAGRTVNSLSQDWGTPPKYLLSIAKVLGKVALDPCSNSHSLVQAATNYQLPQQNGLLENWNFPTIYVNPPYGRDQNTRTTIANWLERCSEAHEKYHSQVLALIPVATNTRHWKENIFRRATAVCFLADTRLKFLVNGVESKKGAPMACAMVYWGNQLDLFEKVFSLQGQVFLINQKTN